MIRIIHILYSFDIGGLETGIVNLVNKMDSNKFSHSICIFSRSIGSLEKIKNKNIKIFIVNRKFRHDPTVIFRLVSLLKRENPDLVRTYNWSGMEGIAAATLVGIKHIIHSEHGFNLEEIFKQKIRRMLTRKVLFNSCDKVIVVSKFLEKWLIEKVGLESNKIIYLPNGCDTKFFFPGRDETKRQQLGIRDNEIIIGTVGSLKELKDQESLAKAFAKLNKSYNNLKLLIIGDGPKRKDLEIFVGDLGLAGRIIFTGNVADTAVFYRAMDIFALTSISENEPNTLLEAMATGLPIVATDVGDVRYMLDGENGGIVVKPKDIYAIADGIEYFLKNKQAARDKGGFVRKRTEELFNLERMVSAYEKLYLDILENKRS